MCAVKRLAIGGENNPCSHSRRGPGGERTGIELLEKLYVVFAIRPDLNGEPARLENLVALALYNSHCISDAIAVRYVNSSR
jgi:hypothetical protein